MESVGKQITRGGLWMLLFKFADRALAVVSMAALARLLTPADFGLVAMATSLIAAIEIMTSFGFDIALIRDSEISRARFDSAWTLNVLLGVSCALLLLALTEPAVGFYSEPRLRTLIPLLALGTAIGGCENIGTVSFRRRLDFRKEFIFLTAKRVASFAAALSLAVWLRSYWALAIGIVVSRVAGVVISYALESYRPRWSLVEAGPLFHTSKWLLFTNLISFMQSRLPDFMIGRISGAHDVGLYSAAADISRMPTTEIAAPINRAVYPGYAKYANDVSALCQTYLKVAAGIWTLALPAAVGLSFVAQPFVMLFLGEQWLEIVPVVRILAFAGLCSLIISNQYYVYLALDKNSIVTRLASIQLASMFVGILLLLPRMGIIGVAYAALAAAVLDVPLSFAVFRHVSRISWMALLHAAWRPMIATAAMLGVLNLLHPSGLESTAQTAQAAQVLLTTAATGAFVYVAILIAAWKAAGSPSGPESQGLTLLQERLFSARAGERA